MELGEGHDVGVGWHGLEENRWVAVCVDKARAVENEAAAERIGARDVVIDRGDGVLRVGVAGRRVPQQADFHGYRISRLISQTLISDSNQGIRAVAAGCG